MHHWDGISVFVRAPGKPDPIKEDKDLTDLQREADRQKSEWPDTEEAGEDAVIFRDEDP